MAPAFRVLAIPEILSFEKALKNLERATIPHCRVFDSEVFVLGRKESV